MKPDGTAIGERVGKFLNAYVRPEQYAEAREEILQILEAASEDHMEIFKETVHEVFGQL